MTHARKPQKPVTVSGHPAAAATEATVDFRAIMQKPLALSGVRQVRCLDGASLRHLVMTRHPASHIPTPLTALEKRA